VLSIDVLNSGYKPTPPGPGWDVRLPATWPATTSTLIAGEHDAIQLGGGVLAHTRLLRRGRTGRPLAAWEEPGLLAAELRAAFRELR
jgi:hypothetical protein